MHKLCIHISLCGLLLAVGSAGFAQSFTLYSGASGVTPDDASWGWNYLSTGGSAVKAASGGVTTLDSTASDGISAGFSTVTSARSTPFVLNNALGYTVGFDVQVNSENHSNASADKNADGLADRSGVSLIVLGSDHKGVEMAFWQNEIWPQQDNPLFIHNPVTERAQGANLTSLLAHYNLSVKGTTYALHRRRRRSLDRQPAGLRRERGGICALHKSEFPLLRRRHDLGTRQRQYRRRDGHACYPRTRGLDADRQRSDRQWHALETEEAPLLLMASGGQ